MDGETLVSGLGIGATIAVAIGILKAATPAGWWTGRIKVAPLLALIFAAAVVVGGVASGEIEGGVLVLVFLVVAQAAEAIGARELLRVVAPDAGVGTNLNIGGRLLPDDGAR